MFKISFNWPSKWQPMLKQEFVLPHPSMSSPVWWHTEASRSRTRSPGTAQWGRRQRDRWCKICCWLFWRSSRRSRWSRDPPGRSGSSQIEAAQSRWGSRPRTRWSPGRSCGSWKSPPQWAPPWCCTAHRRGQPGRWGRRCLQGRKGKGDH